MTGLNGSRTELRASATSTPSLWPDAKLTGVELAEGMVSPATRLNPDAIFLNAQAESIPLQDECADIVLSSISFHHWAGHEQGVRGGVRILRPDGVFCLTDHTFRLTNITGERARSRRYIRTLMEGAGIEILLQGNAGRPFVAITVGRKQLVCAGHERRINSPATRRFSA